MRLTVYLNTTPSPSSPLFGGHDEQDAACEFAAIRASLRAVRRGAGIQSPDRATSCARGAIHRQSPLARRDDPSSFSSL